MDSLKFLKFDFAIYAYQISQFHQTKQNDRQSRYDAGESLTAAGERVHDLPPCRPHLLNWKGKLLQQWKQQEEQGDNQSAQLRRRDQKFQRKEQQRVTARQITLPVRDAGHFSAQDNEAPMQIDTSVQAHRLHEEEVVRSERLPFQTTEQDSPAIRLFHGIPLSIEGAAAIRKLSSSFQAMLLKFSARQEDTAFQRVLGECANAGYLPAVAAMVHTQKQLGNLIADWSTHRSTLRLAQESHILKSITGMQHGKGMPTQQNIDDLKAWCTNEQGEVDFGLLRSITSMQNGKGMPTRRNIDDLKAWCTNEQGKIDFALLRSITSMQNGKGMPTQQNIDDLKAWCTNEQGEVDFVLLRSITGMQHGKGMPIQQNINDLKAWCTNEQGQVDFSLLRSITGMQNGKGMPTRQNINDLKAWCTDERGKVDFVLLRSVTGMQGGKGMPTQQNINDLKAWCTNDQGEVDFVMLRSITSMQGRKGVPTQQNINDLRAWCTNKQGRVDFVLLRSINSMQSGKGMPTQQNINDLKAWCTDEQGQVDFVLLRFITGMQNGKGMPSKENFEALKLQYRLKHQQTAGS